MMKNELVILKVIECLKKNPELVDDEICTPFESGVKYGYQYALNERERDMLSGKAIGKLLNALNVSDIEEALKEVKSLNICVENMELTIDSLLQDLREAYKKMET